MSISTLKASSKRSTNFKADSVQVGIVETINLQAQVKI